MRGLRIAVIAVLLAPFLLLSLLSTQVMLSPSDQGAVALVICTGHGPLEILFDEAGNPIESPDSGQGKNAQNICDWASLAQHSTLTAQTDLLPVMVKAQALQSHPTTFILRASRATGLPPSTGPPLAA